MPSQPNEGLIIKTYTDILKTVVLFADIEEHNILKLLSCLDARTTQWKKGSFIISPDDIVDNVGIMLCGQLHIIKESSQGDRMIISTVSPGDMFAEALCFAGNVRSPISVVAETDAKIILFSYKNMLRTCGEFCEFHRKLNENMMRVLASKNLHLQSRIDILSNKTLRSKIMSYLLSQLKREGELFTIPFNREELADFLCIDRSALSRELGRMKKEGIIDFWKNQFRIV